MNFRTILFIACLIPTSLAARDVRVNVNKANVRDRPSMYSGQVSFQLDKITQAHIIEENKDWYYIEVIRGAMQSKRGWIHRSVIELGPENPPKAGPMYGPFSREGMLGYLEMLRAMEWALGPHNVSVAPLEAFRYLFPEYDDVSDKKLGEKIYAHFYWYLGDEEEFRRHFFRKVSEGLVTIPKAAARASSQPAYSKYSLPERIVAQPEYSNSSSYSRSNYELEVSYNDELFIINGEKFEAKTYCFNMEEGDPIVFIDGSALGVCVTATLLNKRTNDICEVWCD